MALVPSSFHSPALQTLEKRRAFHKPLRQATVHLRRKIARVLDLWINRRKPFFNKALAQLIFNLSQNREQLRVAKSHTGMLNEYHYHLAILKA